jgi:hypothetical protein
VPDFIKNHTIYAGKYKTHSEAVVISCFFNPQNSPYRLRAFELFYESIRHLNHRIIECVIGDASPQLPQNDHIRRIYTPNLLWHKESMLNAIIAGLPKQYKYVFWVDADVLFTNRSWLTQGVKALQQNNIIQPFEYCVHMDRDETAPSFKLGASAAFAFVDYETLYKNNVWRSFCSNYAENRRWESEEYNEHGHVGFAWGARREVLDAVPLYDKALIGGADHIIAHAAAGQVPHLCITKSFTDNIDDVNGWSHRFSQVVSRKIGYVKGNLYHIWHGDIKNREYLKRIRDFTAKTKHIVERDENGLYVTDRRDDDYMKQYFSKREVTQESLDKERLEREAAERIRIELEQKYPGQNAAVIQAILYGYLADSVFLESYIHHDMPANILTDSDERLQYVHTHADTHVHTDSHARMHTDGHLPPVEVPDTIVNDSIPLQDHFS